MDNNKRYNMKLVIFFSNSPGWNEKFSYRPLKLKKSLIEKNQLEDLLTQSFYKNPLIYRTYDR